MHNDSTQPYQAPPESNPTMLPDSSLGVPAPPYNDIGFSELPPDYTAASQPSYNIGFSAE
ncbi:hypothetical protein Ciccas_003087 [Cichlidogyrus casuarinus]|uniref:Uncharacterized protein n=1 Tax=Cichlidogyrus casuarinus TaxID=1844966 RepID=A0ABD2QFE3_9PLAT